MSSSNTPSNPKKAKTRNSATKGKFSKNYSSK